jgi:predicted TPR repeat methyltransferase
MDGESDEYATEHDDGAATVDMTESMRTAMSLNGDTSKLVSFYDEWAADYDEDVASHGYGLPEMMVTVVRDATAAIPMPSPSETRVLDAGCGTGLVGLALQAAGYTEIHGVDLSASMAQRAEATGAYRSIVGEFDLTLPPPDNMLDAFDLVTVGGVFTTGHVPPETVGTIAAMCRHGGVLVLSTRAAYVDETDFAAAMKHMERDGFVELVRRVRDAPYTMDSTGDYWTFRRP